MPRWWSIAGAVCLFLLCSCRPRPVRLPLEDEVLIRVLADVHIAEAALQNLLGKTKDSLANVYYEQICEIHGVDRALLDSSMLLLQNNPNRLEGIYVEVMKELERLDAAVSEQ
jgi:hypothetical protein